MHSSSASIADALSAEEVCPLCLDHYTAADECTCVVCRAPSCPGCAEVIDADGAVRCFACRPVRSFVAAKQSSGVPVSLPRPIPLPIAARSSAAERKVQGLPPLPFPLTSSPRGVRVLNPKPVGSVFVGLPALPPGLGAALAQPQPAAPLLAHAARLRNVAGVQFARARSQLAQQVSRWSQRGRQRLRALAIELPRHGRSIARRWPALVRRSSVAGRALAERLPMVKRALAERLPGFRRALHALYRSGLRSLKLPTSFSARLVRPRAPVAQQNEASRPISL